MDLPTEVLVILLIVVLFLFGITCYCIYYTNEELPERTRTKSNSFDIEQSVIINDLHFLNEIKETKEDEEKDNVISTFNKDSWIYQDYFYNRGILDPESFK